VRISDPRARHHRSYGRKRNEDNECENNPVKDPGETFSNW
jgi:hypothetical protein